MENVGWISAVVIGGLAGWVAEKVMRSDMGLLANIVLGIVGAFALNLVLGLFTDLDGSGRLAYFVVALIGACLLIAVARAVRGNRRRM